MSGASAAERLLLAARQSVALGLNHGTTGNLSVRTPDGFLVTPSGLPCDGLAEADLVAVRLDGTVAGGHRAPSSEWHLHRDLYVARPDAGAIVHAHPRFCTTIACLREDLPPVHYMLAIAGSDRIRCSRYATFGTRELGAAAVEAMGAASACLLANHGLVALGTTPEAALRVAAEVETVAEYWWRARAVGVPVVLSAEDMAAARARFEDYGRTGG